MKAGILLLAVWRLLLLLVVAAAMLGRRRRAARKRVEHVGVRKVVVVAARPLCRRRVVRKLLLLGVHHHLVVCPLRELRVGGIKVRRGGMRVRLLLLRLAGVVLREECRVERLRGNRRRPRSLRLLVHRIWIRLRGCRLRRWRLIARCRRMAGRWVAAAAACRRWMLVCWRRALFGDVHGRVSRGILPVRRCENGHPHGMQVPFVWRAAAARAMAAAMAAAAMAGRASGTMRVSVGAADRCGRARTAFGGEWRTGSASGTASATSKSLSVVDVVNDDENALLQSYQPLLCNSQPSHVVTPCPNPARPRLVLGYSGKCIQLVFLLHVL